MTTGLRHARDYTSGSQFTGLDRRHQLLRDASPRGASTGYLAVDDRRRSVRRWRPSSSPRRPASTLAYGTVAGSIKVTFTGSANAPGGQTYTARPAPTSSMTTGCVSGTDHVGRQPHRPGVRRGLAGTATTSRSPPPRRAATSPRPPSAVAGPQAATSQIGAPTDLTTAPSATTAGRDHRHVHRARAAPRRRATPRRSARTPR